MNKIKCSELILDYNLYPRCTIDSQHCGNIRLAMEAGTKMPPIIVCSKSKRVIDGFHRIIAAKRLHGKNAELDVIFKEYKNEGLMFLDAVRYNATHGRNLTTYDRSHCAIVAINFGINDKDISTCLNVKKSWLGELRKDRTAFINSTIIPLKRTIRHMRGKKLTVEQQEVNKKLSGMNQLFYVNQLIFLLESNLINKADDNLIDGLKTLHGLIVVFNRPFTREFKK